MYLLQVCYDPLFSRSDVYLFRDIVTINLNLDLLLRIISLQLTMCTFSFFCEILLQKYQIDGTHVRVYHSRICQ